MDIEQLVKNEWRQLGFYYDLDDRLSVNQWRFYGSKQGLRNLASWLARANSYAGDHVHLGPGCYFTLDTRYWRTIAERGFLGTVGELEDLSEIIERKIAQTPPGGTFSIDDEYGTDNTVTTKFFVMEASFDPVSMDELVVSGRQAIVNESRSNLTQKSLLSLLPAEIASQSISPREVVLPQREALLAIDFFESMGLLILGWEGWVRNREGPVGHGSAPQGPVSLHELSVPEAAAFCRETIPREAAAWAAKYPNSDEELYFCLTVRT